MSADRSSVKGRTQQSWTSGPTAREGAHYFQKEGGSAYCRGRRNLS